MGSLHDLSAMTPRLHICRDEWSTEALVLERRAGVREVIVGDPPSDSIVIVCLYIFLIVDLNDLTVGDFCPAGEYYFAEAVTILFDKFAWWGRKFIFWPW